MKNFLQVNDLTYYFNEDEMILNRLNLTINKGDFVSILGPSGSGKTSLLRILAGLSKQQSGSILLDEIIISDDKLMIPPEKRNIGLVVQDKALFPHLTVYKNIIFGIRNLPDKELIAINMLKLFKITKHKNKYPYELSGGEQQRVALARALAPKPKLLLLDEPFDGLDSKLKSELYGEIKNIVKSKNITVVMVSHHLDEAKLLSDRVLHIKHAHLN